MPISPDLQAFTPAYGKGLPQLVWTTLVADLETPVSAYLKLADGRANSFLLESVEGGSVRPLLDHRLQARCDLALHQGQG